MREVVTYFVVIQVIKSLCIFHCWLEGLIAWKVAFQLPLSKEIIHKLWMETQHCICICNLKHKKGIC